MSGDDKIRDLLFLTYLTGYDIKDIYSILSQGDNYNLEEYFRSKYRNGTLFFPSSTDLERAVIRANQDAAHAFDYLKYQGIKAIPYTSTKYPASLRHLKDCPPLLYVKGALRKGNFAAVVGTREISKYANTTTSKVVDSLIDSGYGIVSGLALGIDTIAHVKAIEREAYTIAVMPNSLDSVYPKENLWLANKILGSGGCLISELIFSINRGKKSFVERNRIQAALSDIVFPIELGVKSGTMHTVNFGKSQGKLICLLQPGERFREVPQYAGLLDLISQQHSKPKSNVVIMSNLNELVEKLKGDQLKIF